MKTILKAVLAGSVAMCLSSQDAAAFSLSSVLGGAAAAAGAERAADQRPVLMAQAGDPTVRIGQLEDEVRKLTGQVQDLNYQLLQMQEQMRQMQKDNEFRFQRLEGGAGAPVPGRQRQQRPQPEHVAAAFERFRLVPEHSGRGERRDGLDLRSGRGAPAHRRSLSGR